MYNTIEATIRHFKHIVDGIKVPAGEAYTFTEGGNGELGFYIVADGTGRPVQGVLPVPVVRPSVDGDAADPRPPDRRHRADLRHDQHDRRRVRQVTPGDAAPGSPGGRDRYRNPTGSPPRRAGACPAVEHRHADDRRQPVTVPKGTNVLEAARTLGLDITAFCYHPGLPVVAQCRQCLVSVEKNPKLQPSCQQTCGDGMVVHTTDKQSTLARKQMLEFTLREPPGRLPDLRQGRRVHAAEALLRARQPGLARRRRRRSTRPRPSTSARTSCSTRSAASCASRCIRTCDDVAGEHQLEFAHRGDHEVLTTAPGEQLDNPYSLNTVDVCPVGALTVEGLPLHDARVGARGDAERLQRLRDRLQHRDPPQARAARGGSCRATTPTSTSTGCATRAASRITTCASSGSPAPTVDGLPAGWDARSRAAARRLDGRGATAGGDRRRAVGGVHATRTTSRSRSSRKALRRHAASTSRRGRRCRSAPTAGCASPTSTRTRRRQGDRGGARPRASSRRTSSMRPRTRCVIALGDVAGSTPRSSAASRSSRCRAHERGPVAAARRSRCPTATGPSTAARSRTARATCSACTPPFAPPGQAIPGWEAVVRLAQRHRRASCAWTHARDVFKDMTAAVPAWNALTWAREARPLAAPLRREPRLSRLATSMQPRPSTADPRLARHQVAVPDPRARDAARLAPDVDRAPAERDDAGPPRSQPRQHRPDQAEGHPPLRRRRREDDLQGGLHPGERPQGRCSRSRRSSRSRRCSSRSAIIPFGPTIYPHNADARRSTTSRCCTQPGRACVRATRSACRCSRSTSASSSTSRCSRSRTTAARSPAGPATTSGRCSAACAARRR